MYPQQVDKNLPASSPTSSVGHDEDWDYPPESPETADYDHEPLSDDNESAEEDSSSDPSIASSDAAPATVQSTPSPSAIEPIEQVASLAPTAPGTPTVQDTASPVSHPVLADAEPLVMQQQPTADVRPRLRRKAAENGEKKILEWTAILKGKNKKPPKCSPKKKVGAFN